MSEHPSQTLISRYVDNDLTADERVQFERHLAECGNCAALLKALQQTVALYHSLEATVPALPAAVEQHLWQCMAQKKPKA
jgi:anti-sigma factor RsiW